MFCTRCRIAMREERRSCHKKRKWICPRCGRVKMQKIKKMKRDEGLDVERKKITG